MKAGLYLAPLFFALTACMNVNTIPVESKPIRSATYFAKAKHAISEKMREPEATRFKPEYSAYSLSNGDVVVCGTVNGKNAYGGYVGYRPFYIRFRNEAVQSVHFSDDVVGFVTKVCSDAAQNQLMISS